IAEVLKEMGPVQTDGSAAPDAGIGAGFGAGTGGGAGAQARTDSKSGSGAAPKRLYQIRAGAMLSGVCTGLAAYLNIDVTIVRIMFVVLTLLTGGLRSE